MNNPGGTDAMLSRVVAGQRGHLDIIVIHFGSRANRTDRFGIGEKRRIMDDF